MRPILLPLAVLQILLSAAAQEVLSPSVVLRPTDDPRLLLGSYPLSRDLPPVVDGDTIRVEGLRPSLRLIGIDTEETFKDRGNLALARKDWQEYLRVVNAGHPPDRPPKYGTPMGEAAKVFATTFFEGVDEVRLEYDDPERTKGYYGRHLVHILAHKDGRLVNYNVEAVRHGYSPYFVKYGRSARYHEAFTRAEAEARKASRGVWGSPPQHACYPDYPQRLAWWAERDRDQQHANTLRRTTKDFYVLGIDKDWKELTRRVGHRVTVAGTVSGQRQAGDRLIVYLGHQRGMDFAIVGPKATLTHHRLTREPGNLLLVTGEISLYKDRPQFLLETVTVERVGSQTKR
jgi:micrococcal nuclease